MQRNKGELLMKKIILISGKAENGKTTTAELLKSKLESLGNKVIITRYAYYLKDLAARYCGWDGTKDKKGRPKFNTNTSDMSFYPLQLLAKSFACHRSSVYIYCCLWSSLFVAGKHI